MRTFTKVVLDGEHDEAFEYLARSFSMDIDSIDLEITYKITEYYSGSHLEPEERVEAELYEAKIVAINDIALQKTQDFAYEVPQEWMIDDDEELTRQAKESTFGDPEDY